MINRKKGISLVVLIITIIVILILVSAILVSFNSSNPINKSKEARFKSDLKSFNEQLLANHSDKEIVDTDYDREDINVELNNYPKMKLYIPDITEEYCKKLFIEKGKLLYIGNDGVNVYTNTLESFDEYKEGVNVSQYFQSYYDQNEEKWARSIGVNSPYAIYGDVDGDGYVTEEDYRYIDGFSVDSFKISTLSARQFKSMDVNKDNTIDILDSVDIKKFVTGEEVDNVGRYIEE